MTDGCKLKHAEDVTVPIRQSTAPHYSKKRVNAWFYYIHSNFNFNYVESLVKPGVRIDS